MTIFAVMRITTMDTLKNNAKWFNRPMAALSLITSYYYCSCSSMKYEDIASEECLHFDEEIKSLCVLPFNNSKITVSTKILKWSSFKDTKHAALNKNVCAV